MALWTFCLREYWGDLSLACWSSDNSKCCLHVSGGTLLGKAAWYCVLGTERPGPAGLLFKRMLTSEPWPSSVGSPCELPSDCVLPLRPRMLAYSETCAVDSRCMWVVWFQGDFAIEEKPRMLVMHRVQNYTGNG